MNILDFNVFKANFEKDIKRYENKNPVRRNSSYDVVRYRETYEKLEVDYVPD